jgi:hypothetical protein
MHPVLAAALANPRMPRPYGADRADHRVGRYSYDDNAKMDVVTFMKSRPGWGSHPDLAAADEVDRLAYDSRETLH